MRVTNVLLLATTAAANYDDPRKGGCPANNSECWLPFSAEDAPLLPPLRCLRPLAPLRRVFAASSTLTPTSGSPDPLVVRAVPAKFPFGGCMCLPKCTGGTCPAATGATAIPTCEFSSTGKPPPDH